MSDNSLFEVFENSGQLETTESTEANRQIAENKAALEKCIRNDDDYRKLAVELKIIPNDFINARFDREQIKVNIGKQRERECRNFKVNNFDTYIEICNNIIYQIKSGKIPNRSFLIGAPNGFGKQSFITECLVASLSNGWLTVPYISLNELAGIAAADEEANYRGLMNPKSRVGSQIYSYKDDKYIDPEQAYLEDRDTYNFDTIRYLYNKKPQFITGSFSWSEYINAPVLFVFFSGINNRRMEAQIFKSLLMIRSAKGYPTIATTCDSIEPYEKDTTISYFWKDIVFKSPKKDAVKSYIDENDKGMALHVSCYKYMGDRV